MDSSKEEFVRTLKEGNIDALKIVPIPCKFSIEYNAIKSDCVVEKGDGEYDLWEALDKCLGFMVLLPYHHFYVERKDARIIQDLVSSGVKLCPAKTPSAMEGVFEHVATTLSNGGSYVITEEPSPPDVSYSLSLVVRNDTGSVKSKPVLRLPVCNLDTYSAIRSTEGRALTKEEEGILSSLGEKDIAESSIFLVAKNILFQGDVLKYTMLDEDALSTYDNFNLQELSVGFLVSIKGVLDSCFVNLSGISFVRALMHKGVRLLLPRNKLALSKLLGLENKRSFGGTMEYYVEESKSYSKGEAVLYIMGAEEYFSNASGVEPLFVSYLSTTGCNKPTTGSNSALSVVALKLNGRVVGYRFLDGDKKYDISIECASSLGLTGFKVEKQLSLRSVSGVLLSKGELKSKNIVKDISDNTELVSELFNRLITGSTK